MGYCTQTSQIIAEVYRDCKLFFRIRRIAHASLVRSIRSDIQAKYSRAFLYGVLYRWRLEFVDNSMHSIHYVVDVKVYKQPYTLVHEFEIGQ